MNNFDVEHLHYQNPKLHSAVSTYEFIADLAAKNENLIMFFNSSAIVAKHEFCLNSYDDKSKNLDTNNIYYVTDQDNCGDYEGRTYYGYDCLVAIASKSTRRGYICPSMIIETDGDGRARRDTGQRLLRLLRTRCARPQIHAIIYFVAENVIKLVKTGFMQCMNKSRYTLCHLPFNYDDGLRT